MKLPKEEFRSIIEEVASAYSVQPNRLLGRRRFPELVAARQAAMVICHQRVRSLTETGALFNRDHGTIYHAIRAVEARVTVDAEAKRDWLAVRHLAYGPPPPEMTDYQI